MILPTRPSHGPLSTKPTTIQPVSMSGKNCFLEIPFHFPSITPPFFQTLTFIFPTRHPPKSNPTTTQPPHIQSPTSNNPATKTQQKKHQALPYLPSSLTTPHQNQINQPKAEHRLPLTEPINSPYPLIPLNSPNLNKSQIFFLKKGSLGLGTSSDSGNHRIRTRVERSTGT